MLSSRLYSMEAPVAVREPAPAAGAAQVGLVIGAAGVLGTAAVGVAERLAREGIRPVLYAGSGAGALFAAALALDLPKTLLRELGGALWPAGRPAAAGRGGHDPVRTLAGWLGDVRIEQLPTALRIATTDAATGQGLVLARGNLAAALGTSLQGAGAKGVRKLVTGPIADPLPLSAAGGLPVLIALSLQERAPQGLPGSSVALLASLVQARIDAARARGQRVVHIDVDLGRRTGPWDAQAMPWLFEAGWRAAESRLLDVLAVVEDARLRVAA
jgi:NTE family protein